jgi:uncharacterized protein (DUF433 family)
MNCTMSREIVSTRDTCTGEPRIDGTRLTCANVVFTLTLGEMRLDEFIRTYPYLTIADVKRCADYCASRQCVAQRVLNFCQGCSLDKRKPESCMNPGHTNGTNRDELEFGDETEDEPVDGWNYAQELLDTQLQRRAT